jgi:hypothetical protein
MGGFCTKTTAGLARIKIIKVLIAWNAYLNGARKDRRFNEWTQYSFI